jgi:hypothetical protein
MDLRRPCGGDKSDERDASLHSLQLINHLTEPSSQPKQADVSLRVRGARLNMSPRFQPDAG